MTEFHHRATGRNNGAPLKQEESPSAAFATQYRLPPDRVWRSALPAYRWYGDDLRHAQEAQKVQPRPTHCLSNRITSISAGMFATGDNSPDHRGLHRIFSKSDRITSHCYHSITFGSGSKALLVSHWPVETTSARVLITDLFRRWVCEPGMAKSEALRRAMMGMIDGPGFIDRGSGEIVYSYAHPIFWAPFSLIGDGGVERPAS